MTQKHNKRIKTKSYAYFMKHNINVFSYLDISLFNFRNQGLYVMEKCLSFYCPLQKHWKPGEVFENQQFALNYKK